MNQISQYTYAGSSHLSEATWGRHNSFSEPFPPGLKRPNGAGAYDMSGNLYEWVQDWYGDDYYEKCHETGVVKDPQGPKSGGRKVVRGGSWDDYDPDFFRVSDRLTDQTHNRDALKEYFPRGPARVILYIDDLDRCPPNRVVEVLEAVQLLLNTKLFVVVLGIDDRYIARALEQVYQGVLKRGGQPSGIDYLEKIIEIPYRLRPLSPTNVDSYLRSQLKLRQPTSPKQTQSNQSTNQSTISMWEI